MSASTIEPQPTDAAAMTRAERMELSKLAQMRARVALAKVAQRAAELRADVESQLSATYKFTDGAWADITEAADKAVTEAKRAMTAKCDALGIPRDLAPGLYLQWYDRGESGVPKRRAELRKTAQAKIEAAAKQAKATIEANALEIRTELLAGGLTTSAAHEFLASMPTPVELMPVIDVKAIGGGR